LPSTGGKRAKQHEQAGLAERIGHGRDYRDRGLISAKEACGLADRMPRLADADRDG